MLACEESYGYLPYDCVRDKDANAASLAIVEMIAQLSKEGRTVVEHLESLYGKYGYFGQHTVNILHDGAEGANKIAKIINSYSTDKPHEINGIKVCKSRNFGDSGHLDEDGKELPVENFFFFELENGYSVAVRASGTEPKIKYYLFCRTELSSRDALKDARKETDRNLVALAEWAKEDAEKRTV